MTDEELEQALVMVPMARVLGTLANLRYTDQITAEQFRRWLPFEMGEVPHDQAD